MANLTSATGEWVESIFYRMAYQPDDQVSYKALDEDLSPDFDATINNQPFTKETFMQAVAEARIAGKLVLETSRELLATPAAEGEDATVALIQTFAFEKEEGTKRGTSLTICHVVFKDGKRSLVRMTEVQTFN